MRQECCFPCHSAVQPPALPFSCMQRRQTVIAHSHGKRAPGYAATPLQHLISFSSPSPPLLWPRRPVITNL